MVVGCLYGRRLHLVCSVNGWELRWDLQGTTLQLISNFGSSLAWLAGGPGGDFGGTNSEISGPCRDVVGAARKFVWIVCAMWAVTFNEARAGCRFLETKIKCVFAAEVRNKKMAARAGHLPGLAEGRPGRFAKIIHWNFPPIADSEKVSVRLKSSGFA